MMSRSSSGWSARHTYDPATGLFYHGWDESKEQAWANKTTGTSPNFWSRAIGWYAMALVDALDYFPADHPARPEIIAMLQKVCAGVVRYQDADSGLWYQVTDQGDRPGNYLEATGSSMFVYALAKGINHGYLSRDYLPVLLKGYAGLVSRLVKVDGKGAATLTQCCSVSGTRLRARRNFCLLRRRARRGQRSQRDRALHPRGSWKCSACSACRSRRPSRRRWNRPRRPRRRSTPLRRSGPGCPPFWRASRRRCFPPGNFRSRTTARWRTGRRTAPRPSRRRSPPVTRRAAGTSRWRPRAFFSPAPSTCWQRRSSRRRRLDAPVPHRSGPLPARRVYTRWEGVECYNYSPLIYAFEQENIAVTGDGTLDGAASDANWWAWTQRGPDAGSRPRPTRAALNQLGDQGVPVAQRQLRRGPFPAPQFHPAVPLPQRPDRRRAHPPVADVGGQSRALHQRHRARRRHRLHRPEQRRLRPGVVPRRADRELPVHHRRRLHRDQIRAQRRRPPRGRAVGEPRHPPLHHEGWPRRRGHRQRDVRRLPQRLRGGLRDGQPAPRPRTADQIQRPPRGRHRKRLHAPRRGRAGRRGDADGRFRLRGGRRGALPSGAAQRGPRGHHQPRQPARHVGQGLCRLGDRRRAFCRLHVPRGAVG